MNIPHRLQRSFKPRFAVVYPFALFFLFFCSLNPVSLKAGLVFIIAGALIRLWSNGYAIKNDKLTSSGPYAFVRNPLYLGTFLIAIGFVIVLTSKPPLLEWIVGTLFLLALSFMYYRTIKAEQGMLLTKFKNDYKEYCRNVPAMLPGFKAYSKGEKWPFSLKRLMFSKEHKPVFWVFILLVIFQLKTQLFIEHRGLDQNSWDLITISVFLILLDAVFEFNKKKFNTKA